MKKIRIAIIPSLILWISFFACQTKNAEVSNTKVQQTITNSSFKGPIPLFDIGVENLHGFTFISTAAPNNCSKQPKGDKAKGANIEIVVDLKNRVRILKHRTFSTADCDPKSYIGVAWEARIKISDVNRKVEKDHYLIETIHGKAFYGDGSEVPVGRTKITKVLYEVYQNKICMVHFRGEKKADPKCSNFFYLKH